MGFDIGYAGYSLGFSQNEGEAVQSVSISNSEFCTKSDDQFSREYISSNETQVASIAVNAWLQCIQSQNQLYLSYTGSPSGNYVSGTMYVSVNTGMLERTLKGLQVGSEGEVDVTCTINTETLMAGTVSYELPATANRFNCVKTGESPAEVSFITNQGPLDIIPMVQRDPISEELQALNQNLEATRSAQSDLDTRLAEANVTINVLTARLQAVEGRTLRDASNGIVDRGTFWTAQDGTNPRVYCPEGQVLAGFDFDAWSDGTIRGVGTIRYLCRSAQ